MRSIRLELAFAWTCPACNRRNYIEGKPMEEVDQAEIVRQVLGLDPWESTENLGGELMMQPNRVQCQCGDHFFVEFPEDNLT